MGSRPPPRRRPGPVARALSRAPLAVGPGRWRCRWSPGRPTRRQDRSPPASRLPAAPDRAPALKDLTQNAPPTGHCLMAQAVGPLLQRCAAIAKASVRGSPTGQRQTLALRAAASKRRAMASSGGRTPDRTRTDGAADGGGGSCGEARRVLPLRRRSMPTRRCRPYKSPVLADAKLQPKEHFASPVAESASSPPSSEPTPPGWPTCLSRLRLKTLAGVSIERLLNARSGWRDGRRSHPAKRNFLVRPGPVSETQGR